jgi:hypothetical protein
MIKFSSVLLLILLSACSSSIHLYNGSQLPPEKTTKISFTPSEDVVLEALRIDGIIITKKSAYVLPGEHTIKVTFKDWYKNTSLSNRYPFMARVERAVCTAKLITKEHESYLLTLNDGGGIFLNGQSLPKMKIRNESSPLSKLKGRCEVRDPTLPIE